MFQHKQYFQFTLLHTKKKRKKKKTVGVPRNSDDLIYAWHHCGTYPET